MDHTVHVLDLIRALTGSDATRVYAEIDNRMLGQDCDDTGLLSVDFSDGSFATIDASWSVPKSAPFWGNVRMTVVGTDGFADLDMFAQKVELLSDKSGHLSYEYWGDDMDMGLVKSFINSLAEDKDVPISGEDGAKASEVVEAAYRSAESHSAVTLPL
jgi:predicted dehydrogenase